ncbi:ABC transporter ATP-binding protein [Sphingomonas sp. BN140010]|uniref:ABC transporter ATP-binding protein n=1 Tax=Sphingomonas arvum TaxID=2992113 RepID=A0ABT3JBZ6_9SPHN|nr:ABC transporter ATP-binding protein [Sphingomonas sp. BN140010]MCW3796593.1 ABC transporter ATP-binding protein [Sphingomonas sp. BN140010]
MPGLQLRGVAKSFRNTEVLSNVDLDVAPREFIAFLGPSGSGKSTLLRIIAGLETADAGEVILDDRRIDGLPPGQRGVAMVFQHYALYPHMSVRQNMAFGLRNARVPQDQIDRLVEDAARVLEIDPLLERKPAQLSGGQRQRVAIGRAIVKSPKLFLLDEPLSNLDAALRLRTRVELAQLRERVESAFIMVTHDQAEAMTLADRIVVFNDRRIQQIAAPMEIYARPANRFVAQFVGSPAMSILPATLADGGTLASVKLGDGSRIDTSVGRDSLPAGAQVELGLRPEHVRVVLSGEANTEATVDLVERLGERSLVYARLRDGQQVTAEAEGTTTAKVGDTVGLRIDGAAAHLFGPDGTGYHRAAA